VGRGVAGCARSGGGEEAAHSWGRRCENQKGGEGRDKTRRVSNRHRADIHAPPPSTPNPSQVRSSTLSITPKMVDGVKGLP
jgi:hypothetical protein